ARQVGLMFLISAPPAGAANYLSGALSDRVGRKPLVVAGFLAASANLVALAAVGRNIWAGFALVALLGVTGAPAYSLWRPLVADLVADPGREQAYASVRVAENLAVALGPPLGSLLLFVAGWRGFLLGLACLALV